VPYYFSLVELQSQDEISTALHIDLVLSLQVAHAELLNGHRNAFDIGTSNRVPKQDHLMTHGWQVLGSEFIKHSGILTIEYEHP
jgi:hypothetical protein